MRKILNKRTLITNVIITVIICVVAVVSFVPGKIIAIYSGNGITPIYRGNAQNKNVSIMINVYENSEIVKKMVDTFNKYNAKCTFFIGGCWADDNAETLNYIKNNGFELANHGYFHKDHKKLSYSANIQEISLCNDIVEGLCGEKTKLFAPPSGSFGENTLKACLDLDYKVIMWSKDTIDWRDKEEEKLYERATKNPSNGDLILMHPKESSLNILPKILEFYINIGYNIVTVSENIK